MPASVRLSPRPRLDLKGSLPAFSTIPPSNTILLGVPLIGPGSVSDRALETRCSDLRTAITKLKTIFVHDALILLRLILMLLDFYTPSHVHPVMVIFFYAPTMTFSKSASEQLILPPSRPSVDPSQPSNSAGRFGNQTCFFTGPFRLFGFFHEHV